jgi:hypothetical protein
VVVTALGVLVAAAAGPSAATDQSSVRRELEALYGQYSKALRRDDSGYSLKRWFLDHTTEDFLLKQDGKKLSREEAAEKLEEQAIARFTGYDYRIVSLTVKGKEAVVLYKDKATAILEDAAENKHKIVAYSTTRDVWVKTPEGWMTRLTEVLNSKTLVNGKEVKPQKAGGKR